VPVYEIKAVDHSKAVVLIATTDTASAALMKFLDALPSYRRVWVATKPEPTSAKRNWWFERLTKSHRLDSLSN